MIALKKAPEPAWLAQNREKKTEEYLEAPPDSKPSPWRRSEITLALADETHDKCMYCEVSISDGAYNAVEHIRPKKQFPANVLTWENLGWACTRCNTSKGHYWSDQEDLQLVNPYEDIPSKHIQFSGPLAIASEGSTRGENTIRQLKFSEREDLLLSRMRAIEALAVRIRLWAREEDCEKKDLFAEDIYSLLQPEREFSAALNSFAKYRGFPGESAP